MVAINRSIITLIALGVVATSASAQELQPRISGLENNSVYMTLLEEDNALTEREDSLAVAVESLRKLYRENPEEAAQSRDRIISFENELFDLRTRKAMVIDSLNIIEQEWVANNMDIVEEKEPQQTIIIKGDSDVKYIYESANVKEYLPAIDYKNLVKSEKAEVEAAALSGEFTVNYDNMLSLKRSYEVTPSQEEAIEIMERFDSLAVANRDILERLNDTWGAIYDNKSFAYSLLMELLGFDDVLLQEAELMRKAQAEISSKQGVGCSDEQLRYLIQKSSMVEFEIVVAERLGINGVVNSLKEERNRLSEIAKESMPELDIEERLFILYEPIEFDSTPRFNAANPIPETVIYDKGVIFRIFVGSFRDRQTVGTFRQTAPLSHRVNELKRHCYYIGGFATFDEAVAAQAQLKAHGFRAPQIVVWSDGRERNLTKEPLPLNASYRIDIANAPVLPEGAKEATLRIAPNSTINKVSTDKFVIMSLDRSSQVDSLVGALQSLDSRMEISVDKSEAKIEF